MGASLRLSIGWINRLKTTRTAPGPAERLVRAVLLMPVVGMLFATWHLRRVLGFGAIAQGRADFDRTFRCRPPDQIQAYILLFGTWEPNLTEFISQRLRNGDVFIDVGANVGYFTLLASRQVGETGIVVGIDASPSNYAELAYNVSNNPGTGNVRVIHRAVSNSHGTVDVYAGPASNVGLATIAPGKRRNLRREASVLAAPLADLLLPEEIRRATLLKIDVEGAEPAVLQGLGDFLRRCNPKLEIVLEMSPKFWTNAALTPEKVLAPLRSAGFNTYVLDNDYVPWRYLWPKAVRSARRIERLPDALEQIDLVLSRIDEDELALA